ncbi:MAG: PBSX family phage terminase large subunit [Blautia sp.]|nr:PBSX family phage terminase large subunit [Blautia sp.]
MMKRKALFRFQPFSRKQRQVLNWWTDESPVKDMDGIIADGAIRSGKTISMSLSFVIWAMTCFNGQDFIMCGKTIGSFRRNVLRWLKVILPGRGYQVEDRRSDNLVIVTRGDVSNSFYIFGGRDESSQDLVQGLTAAGAFFDEVVLMPESFVNQATGRCSVDGSKLWFNCNPEGPHHWFKEEWINYSAGYMGKAAADAEKEAAEKAGEDTKVKNLAYLHFTMEDNLSLAEKIKARYRSQYSGVFFKRYILGLWCMAEGLIYDMFDEDVHTADILDIADKLIDRERYVSVDYGTQNAMAMLLWNKGVDGRWYCIREYYYSGRDNLKQKTDSQYADDFVNWLDGTKIKAVVCDPSAASFIAELRNRGYSVIKADNDVLDGIRKTGTMFNLRKIIICTSCVNLIKELGSYVWDKKAAEHGIEQPVKVFDHAVDSLRYHVYTIMCGKIAKIKDKAKKGLR